MLWENGDANPSFQLKSMIINQEWSGHVGEKTFRKREWILRFSELHGDEKIICSNSCADIWTVDMVFDPCRRLNQDGISHLIAIALVNEAKASTIHVKEPNKWFVSYPMLTGFYKTSFVQKACKRVVPSEIPRLPECFFLIRNVDTEAL